MPKTDGARVVADLKRLAEFGRYKTGVHRPTYSPEDVASREWLAEKFAEAGLDPVIDGIGNVIGHNPRAARRLLVGSHSETQPHGGWLDGALGVIYALEAARAFAADASLAGLGIEPVAWADEEGHYGNMLGSRSFIDALPESEIGAATSRDGMPLRTALEQAGYAGRPREQANPQRYLCYLEAHIEQGDYLDQAGLHLGVVTGIVGIWQYRVAFAGEQNHAGTTRMAVRRDAGVALVKLCGAIATRFAEITGPRSVWTTGAIRLEPGQPSIVPGGAEMLFQIRDVEVAQLQRFEDALNELVAQADQAGPCKVVLECIWKVNPVLMSHSFQDELRRAADHCAPGGAMAMPSAAGHDAQILARKIPAAMLFVPSINGVSHHWTEDTKDEDIVLGCQVLADAAEAIFRKHCA
jgi:beta-ureidopropionase / N-carbamoyl-L-amino-acid hydrolase